MNGKNEAHYKTGDGNKGQGFISNDIALPQEFLYLKWRMENFPEKPEYEIRGITIPGKCFFKLYDQNVFFISRCLSG